MFSFSWVTFWLKELRSKRNAPKIAVLKGILVVVLLAAAALTTLSTYTRLRAAEHDIFKAKFSATARSVMSDLFNSYAGMNYAANELALTYSNVYSEPDDWPNAAWRGFQPVAEFLIKASSVQSLVFMPLLRPEEAPSYVESIRKYYRDGGQSKWDSFSPAVFPNGTVWRVDYTASPPAFVPDMFGNSTQSANQILTPVAQYTLSTISLPNIGNYNAHSDSLYTASMDQVIECVDGHHLTSSVASCSALSPTRDEYNANGELIGDMFAIIVHPIVLENNTELVGFIGAPFSWADLLQKTVQDSMGAIDVVIESPGWTFTYRIKDCVPRLLGKGDRHNPKYDSYVVPSTSHSSTIAVPMSGYTVRIYPTKEFEDSVRTVQPLAGAMLLLAIFVFCTLLFGIYDLLTQREFDRNVTVLDTKRRFVRFISHEIRTPLNTVRLGMKLLEVEMGKFASNVTGAEPNSLSALILGALQAWQTLADEIMESSESAVEVLNDLLNYDKVERGALALEFSCVDLLAVVKRLTSTMQVQAKQKDITLTLQDSWSSRGLSSPTSLATLEHDLEHALEDTRTAVADSVRMDQVLRNLVSNALKFTPAGGRVCVTVTTSAAAIMLPDAVRRSTTIFEGMKPAGVVRIAVKDSGAGLTPHQLEEICAEGVQFNANELQAGQGSGLGLFISKGIVEQHGGRLLVESEGLGKGVTFTVELPLFESMEGPASRSNSVNNSIRSCSAAPTEPTDANAVAAPAARPKRLLVVDDSNLNRKMALRLLRSQDHVCEEAQDGQQALQVYGEMVARGEPPDAILMDFEMPVMNGPAATARLRDMGCTSLIVGVTGNVLPGDKRAFKSAGADCVLPKPLVLEDLSRVLASGTRTPMNKRSKSMRKQASATFATHNKVHISGEAPQEGAQQ